MRVVKDSFLLADLGAIQRQHGCVSPDTLAELARGRRVSASSLSGVASFYSLFDAAPRARFVIRLCDSVACHMDGDRQLIETVSGLLGIRPGESTPDRMFALETVSCLGACGSGPAAMVNDRLHTRLTPEKIATIIACLRAGRTPAAEDPIAPESVRALGGPVLVGATRPGLEDLLGRSAEEILAGVDASGLRGRGGAAFPAGRKWRLCAETPADDRYIVCNADEGEPGTFKDRWLLLQRPELLIAGMALAGRAVGARQGVIYLRGEYDDARRPLEAAIRRAGLATFDIQLVLGAGAYVCGEETALLESIEGRRGVPRLRPPYPPVAGLFGRPTVINNVETFAQVPFIVAHGADWFRQRGTAASAGTKLFCVSGDAARPGLIEAPLGVALREVLLEAGADGLKAALVGGASGRLVGAGEFGRRLCYEDLSPGAGAIIAVGKGRPIRNLAANLMQFFARESCGECAPCRIGTARAREYLAGEKTPEAPLPAVLEKIGRALADGSRCGLGFTAPAALLDALRLFPGDFEQ